MIQCDENWLSVADAFHAAALGAGSWLDALSGLAAATGSRSGELIGLGSGHTVPFNWVTDLGQDWEEEFVAIGGGDPAANPFVRAGAQATALKVLTSADFVTPKERRSNYFLADFARRHDMPYICLTPLIKESGMLVGLAVLRSARQGEIGARERAVFTSLAPHMRSAVKTQMALEHQGALLVAGAMEAHQHLGGRRHGLHCSQAVADENRHGKGDVLRLKLGRLRAVGIIGDGTHMYDMYAMGAGSIQLACFDGGSNNACDGESADVYEGADIVFEHFWDTAQFDAISDTNLPDLQNAAPDFAQGFANVGFEFWHYSQDAGGSGVARLQLNVSSVTVTPVPEAETYAMMLAGLGLVGAMVRRRKNG